MDLKLFALCGLKVIHLMGLGPSALCGLKVAHSMD